MTLTLFNSEKKANKLDVKQEFYIYENYKKEPKKIINEMQIHKNNIIFEIMFKLKSKN
jgi:hypothetical protein